VTPPRVVLMGVAGSGKTVVGRRLAAALDYPFLDADDLHPKANVDKMASGIPLSDDDRWPWLDAVGAAIAARPRVIAACSALRFAYRERLRASVAGLVFVHLDGSPALLAHRIDERKQHFMPSALLDSQLATLERLRDDEAGFTVDVTPGLGDLVTLITTRLEQLA
jgi:gluconokinase